MRRDSSAVIAAELQPKELVSALFTTKVIKASRSIAFKFSSSKELLGSGKNLLIDSSTLASIDVRHLNPVQLLV